MKYIFGSTPNSGSSSREDLMDLKVGDEVFINRFAGQKQTVEKVGRLYLYVRVHKDKPLVKVERDSCLAYIAGESVGRCYRSAEHRDEVHKVWNAKQRLLDFVNDPDKRNALPVDVAESVVNIMEGSIGSG